jgi:hypothetical protein
LILDRIGARRDRETGAQQQSMSSGLGLGSSRRNGGEKGMMIGRKEKMQDKARGQLKARTI